jgi:hypothetical protein
MSLLEKSLNPQFNSGGLTAGVDYFGRVGQGQRRTMNPGPASPRTAEAEVPQGTGFDTGPSDPGLGGGQGQGMTGEQAFATQMGLAGLGLFGAATGNQDLQQAAGLGGVGVSASQGNYAPAASTVTRMLGGGADAANAVNLATQAYQSYANRATPEKTELDPEGRYLGSTGSIQNANRDASLMSSLGSTIAGQAIPGYNLANMGLLAATGIFGDTPTSIGDIFTYGPMGARNFEGVSSLNAAQGQKVIQNAADPLGTMIGVRGVDISQNPQAMEDARKAAAFAFDTGWGQNRPAGLQAQFDAGQQRVGGMGIDAGSYGLPTVQDDMGPGAPGTAGREAYESFGGGDSGGGGGGDYSFGGYGGGFNEVSYSPSYSSTSDFSVGGDFGSGGNFGSVSGSGGGFGTVSYNNGGMVGDMPGITQRYNNGGMVSGAPNSGGGSLLTMGFADGGMVGMGGKPSPAMVQKRVDMILRDPEARQALLARPQQLMASGELTPDEVTTMARVAEASMFNPDLYPQLRQFVAEQGMTPLPAAYDPLVVTRIMAIAKALQEETPAGEVPSTDQAQVQSPTPGEGNGGYLQGPGTGRSDSIGTVNETTGQPVKVANGEYVVPAHVVRAKGREFFDNLLRRYSDVPKGE